MSEHDVVVAGGGASGVAAAVAAARAGRDVALVESNDKLGGAGTTNLVTDFLNAYWDGERFVIGGLFAELRHRLIGRKALYRTRGPTEGDKHGQEPFDPEAYADELRIVCEEAGVDLLTGTAVTSSEREGGDDGAVAALGLDDGTSLSPGAVVDATGDAVVAANSGVPTRIGAAEDGWIQPLTYCYAVGPVDLDELERELPETVMYDHNVGERWADLSHTEATRERVRAAKEEGGLSLPISDVTTLRSVPGEPERFSVNMGYVTVEDPTDEGQLRAATEEGREQMREGVAFLRERFPGFSDVEVVAEPDRIGVRQSRHIEALYQLSEDDVLSFRQFDDAVAQSCFPVDIHRADGEWEYDEWPEGHHYDVPWRSVIPRAGPRNLVVAGRSIDADTVAFSSVRVQPSMVAVGEASGVTAALAASQGVPVREVSPDAVRAELERLGAVLE